MMKHLFLALLFILVLGCKDSNHKVSENKSKLYDEVMAIHDKIMPEMSTIHALKRDLKSLEDSKSKPHIINKIIELDRAEEAMMAWMADFKVPDDKDLEKVYLTQELLNIKKVGTTMVSSIQDAKFLLDSLKSAKK